MSYLAREVTAAVAAVVLGTACTGDEPPPPRYVQVLPDVHAVEGTKAFDDPAALAFAPNGDLWVGNYEASTLARYTPESIATWGAPKAATVIEGGAIQGPNAMVFDAHGYLWVAMQDGDRVAGFTPRDLANGRPPNRVLPDPDRVLNEPAGVALDDDGNLWVSNSGVGHLVRYPRRGGLEAGTAKPDVVIDVANDDCQGLTVQAAKLWLGCSATDRLYVYSLARLTRSGRPRWQTVLDWKDKRPCGPVQLVVTPTDRVAAACYHTASVAWLGGGRPRELGRVTAQVLTNVHGIAYDATGHLWAGSNLNVLVRFPPQGAHNPDVVLRPVATAVPSLSSEPVYDM